MVVDIGEKIQEAIDIQEVFKLSIGKFNIVITDTMVSMWIVMILLTVLGYVFSRNLKTIPDKKQSLLEVCVEYVGKFCESSMGHYWRAFTPYIGTLALFIIVSNMLGILNILPTGKDLYNLTKIEFFNRIPFYVITPPTRDINVTAALAIVTILVVIGSAVYYKGFGGWLKGLCKPTPLLFPINILELCIKPLSLCLRLFGNILGAHIVVEIVYALCPAIIPIPLSAYFDLFDGVLQAYIFVFLTTIYIGEGLED